MIEINFWISTDVVISFKIPKKDEKPTVFVVIIVFAKTEVVARRFSNPQILKFGTR